MINQTKFKLESAKVTMCNGDMPLDILNEHIQFGIDCLNDEININYSNIGKGCEAVVYKIKKGFVLKCYRDEHSAERTVELYNKLLETDNTALFAKTYGIFEVYKENGLVHSTFIIQEELRPLNSFSGYLQSYQREKFHNFLNGIKDLSLYTAVNDSHSGNLGLDVDGNIKYLDYGMFRGFLRDEYTFALAYAMKDLRIYNWFIKFLEYSKVPAEVMDKIDENTLQNIIDAMEVFEQ